MTRNICYAFIFFLGCSNLFGQQAGQIKYDRTTFYSKIIDELPYLSEEERDRQKLTWGKDEGWAHPYILQFSPEKTLYTYGEREREYNFSWKQEEFLLIHDLQEDHIKHQRVVGGSLFVIEDKRPDYQWKIHNEIREVAGFICMKAEAIDSIKNQTIHAWFTTEIPVSSGPEGFAGLPGMILMLDVNNGTAIIEATEVIMDEVTFDEPKKIKGKQIAYAEYQEVLQTYMERCIEGERNPYWRLRY